MATVKVRCPKCGGEQVSKYGTTNNGKQRYLCINARCEKKIFLLDYSHNAYKPGIKEQVVSMATNASGIRDTARILGISTTTVIKVLKKQNQNYWI